MVNVELYINGKLCDITNPYELGIRLQKEILIPSEITTKDVQYSYTITLPFSVKNDEIFGYANNEEVKNKFNHLYTAELVVDSIKIFKGLFKITSINKSYKGNLYKPSKLTIKEIFGDKKMNENGKWEIPFSDITSSFAKYNSPSSVIQPCIFPLVLYGLLPKVSKNPNAVVGGEKVGEYTAKDLWDEYVRLGVEDFPPAINVLQALKKIFDNNGYVLGGTAFDDLRIKNLYMSYQNPSDYAQEWNWGRLSTFNIKGNWESVRNRWNNNRTFERNIERVESDRGIYYVTDLFNCNRTEFTSISDSGTNVQINKTKDRWNDDNYLKNSAFITIPKSGLYKVKLKTSIGIEEGRDNSGKDSGWRWTDNTTGTIFTSGGQYKRNRCNYFDRKRYEVQLVRDFGSGDFETSNKTTVGFYFHPNNPQNNTFNGDSVENYPKYFPKPYKAQLIDPSTDEKFICGFHWGRPDNDSDYNPKGYPANFMFIKNGYSWNKSYTQKNKIYSAYNNVDGYWCWGTDNNATIDIDPETGEEVEGGDTISLAWRESNRYQTKINNIGNSWVSASNEVNGSGELYQVIWLEKGEHLTLLAVSEANDFRRNTDKTKWNIYPAYMSVNFELEIQPFRTDKSWIKINNNSNGYEDMNWNDEMNFKKDNLDLISFLPSEVKTDEWIDNVCKLFNLTLVSDDNNIFNLNVKQINTLNTSSIINLEGKTNIKNRTNEPLNLPSEFQLGFKINDEEEGFVRTNNDGGGSFKTGTVDGKILSQTSNFLYNWFKPIRKNVNNEGEKKLELPIISNNEVWVDTMNYSEGISKLYTSYAQRFFYYNDTLNSKAGTISLGNKSITVANVTNTYDKDKILILDYENKDNSILTSYFTVISNNDSNYTEIESYLSADEYEKLNGNSLIKYNGDLYYLSSISGYDPTMNNPTKIRLIRKVNK